MSLNIRMLFGSVLCVGIMAIGTSLGAVADDKASSENAKPETALDEIVVTTARRRTESVQSAPVAVTAISEAALASVHAVNISDIAQLTPNLQIAQQAGTADVADIYLRGFGVSTQDPSVDPAIAVYLDGIYQPHVTGTLMDLFDVSEVEVLRGPQGTLLGKNSPSGAIVLSTKKPSGEFGAEVQLDYGAYDRTQAHARLDVPIVENVLAAKFSFINLEGGNYVRNLTVPGNYMGGADTSTGRFGLLFTPNSNVEDYLSTSVTLDRSPQAGLRNATTAQTYPEWSIYSANPSPGVYSPQVACLLGYCDPSSTPPHTTRASFTNGEYIDTTRVSNELTIRTDPVSITSVSGYSDYVGLFNEDIVGEPQVVLNTVNQSLKDVSVSQEVRIASQHGGGLDLGGRLDWVAGVYYFRDRFVYVLPLVTPLFVPDQPEDVPTLTQYENGLDVSKAAFAHAEYTFNEEWSASIGGRQTWDHKDHAGFIGEVGVGPYYSQSRGWQNFSGEVGLKRTISATKMAYVRVAQGYRGGGFDGFPGSLAAAQLSINPETVVSSELGFKADWLDKTIRTNWDLFWSNYSNLQRSLVVPQPQPPGFILGTQNVAKATVRGVELETTAIPITDLTVRANLSYIDAYYKSWPGDPLGILPPANPNGPPAGVSAAGGYAESWAFGFTPKWTFHSSAGYAFPLFNLGAATASVAYTYHSAEFLQDTPSPPARQGGVGLLDATIKLESPNGKTTWQIYGKNLLNKQYIADISANGPLFVVYNDALPLTWGISFGQKF